MEDLLARLSPGHPRLPQDTQRTERFSVPWASLAPLSLLHPLMFSLFLAPATVWHMMHTKFDTMGMILRVAPFLVWLRAETIEPLQGISALTSLNLTDAILAQLQGIRTSLVSPPLHLHLPSQHIPLQKPFQMQAPAPTPEPTRQVVTSSEQWGVDLRSLLRICNARTTYQIPDIWRTMALLEKYRAHTAMESACQRTA